MPTPKNEQIPAKASIIEARDIISTISFDLLSYILCYLSPEELLKIALVSKLLNKASLQPAIWKSHFFNRLELVIKNSQGETVTVQDSFIESNTTIIAYKDLRSYFFKVNDANKVNELIFLFNQPDSKSSDSFIKKFLRKLQQTASSPLSIAKQVVNLLLEQKLKSQIGNENPSSFTLNDCFAGTKDENTICFLAQQGIPLTHENHLKALYGNEACSIVKKTIKILQSNLTSYENFIVEKINNLKKDDLTPLPEPLQVGKKNMIEAWETALFFIKSRLPDNLDLGLYILWSKNISQMLKNCEGHIEHSKMRQEAHRTIHPK